MLARMLPSFARSTRWRRTPMADPPRTILLIDANSADCAAIQRALEHDPIATYTCVTAPTAAAARALCRAAAPNAIVLDDSLPDRDVLTLLAELVGIYGQHGALRDYEIIIRTKSDQRRTILLSSEI